MPNPAEPELIMIRDAMVLEGDRTTPRPTLTVFTVPVVGATSEVMCTLAGGAV